MSEEISNVQKKIMSIFLLLVFFFPVNYFYLYHIVVIIPLAILLLGSKIRLSNALIVLSLFIFYWLIGTSIRFIIQGDNLRDFFEIFRYVPLLFILMLAPKFRQAGSISFNVIIFYLISNFVVSLFQYLFKESSVLVQIIGYIFNSPVHFQESLLLNSRALGFSMGPNSNAVISLLCVIFIFFRYEVTGFFTRILKIAALLCGFFTILLTQSQTGLVTLGVIITYIIIMLVIRKPSKLILPASIFGLFLVIFLTNSNILNDLSRKDGGLYYLSTLFEQGTDRGSYQLRVEKRDQMITRALNSPLYAAIGWGKDYFGDDTSATDNEHLYIGLVYGPLIWLLLLVYGFYYGVKYSMFFIKTGDLKTLFTPVLILSWVVFALPASFITYPESLILGALFLNYGYKQ
ncbi:O-antigen ligase family protein [Citrobacter sp. JGM124]|uniref:O-antigen ligase family protein n=1 Tax=Citrobacter sp. JGM124 TaxID=2799789 RepID=UPI001BADA259|nr:O-antigen ligase family protein [Citrobacter sp. JGM124]MBS0847956.1 O-antigen ligase family protein [Citrobacter sp. JGM124]